MVEDKRGGPDKAPRTTVLSLESPEVQRLFLLPSLYRYTLESLSKRPNHCGRIADDIATMLQLSERELVPDDSAVRQILTVFNVIGLIQDAPSVGKNKRRIFQMTDLGRQVLAEDSRRKQQPELHKS